MKRMTLKRNCFDRIAGAYIVEEGKAIPFSETNVQFQEYAFGESGGKPGSIWQLLMALKECGFLFPAFKDRSSDTERIDIYVAGGNLQKAEDLKQILFGRS